MDFHDFQIRAWQSDASHAQVLVHSSPVGDMREPVTVRLESGALMTFRALFADRAAGDPSVTWADLIAGGQQLAVVLLPPPVYTLLIRSLERIPPDDGLRVRLCLDSALVDLPWECLYRPDASGGDATAGFLALDSRISLVREAPSGTTQALPARRKQRLLFAGAPFMVRGSDYWGIEDERQGLAEALQPVGEYLAVESITGVQTRFEAALAHGPIDIFHYSGHTDAFADGEGFLVQEMRTDPGDGRKYQVWQHPDYRAAYGTDRLYVDLMYVEQLGRLLRVAGTKLAVFSACNSGRWAFVAPLLRAGVPVVIGAQGWLATTAAVAFYHKLYTALAIGLSLDEAVTWARLHLLEPTTLPEDWRWQWAMFMVYMPSPEAVLFPKPRQGQVRERQETARNERRQTIINVNMTIGTMQGGQVTGSSVGQLGARQ